MARVTLRLPDEVHNRLVARSRASATSLNQTIVNRLREALGYGQGVLRDETPKERERRLLREALADLVVDTDPNTFHSLLGPPMDPAERDRLIASIPPMEPPLSHAIIEERKESRY